MWVPLTESGIVIYNWSSQIANALNLEIGDPVDIIEETDSWFRGSTRRSKKPGIFPKNIVYCKKNLNYDNVVNECTEILREWFDIWKRLYVDREPYKFNAIQKGMITLLERRRDLISSTLTQDQIAEMRMIIISKIDWGNRKLGLDLIPRRGPFAVDPNQVGIVTLYDVHFESSAKDVSKPLQKKDVAGCFSQHLYCSVKNFTYRICDDIEIHLYLYNVKHKRILSERFTVLIPKEGFSTYVQKPNLNNNCTIFTDLSTEDFEDTYLVAIFNRIGKILPSEHMKRFEKNNSNSALYKRPFAVGYSNLSDVRNDSSIENDEQEFNLKVYQCDEKDFYMAHDFLTTKLNSKFSSYQAASQIIISVSIKILHGDLKQVQQEQPLLFQGVIISRKIGFSEVIMPGDFRNDIFVTIDKGEFERAGKSTPKNIEVTVMVVENDGNIVSDCLWSSSGICEKMYKSIIIYHHNSPCWNETIRISAPIDKFQNSHIRFEFRHCSTKERVEPKIFAFSYAPLMQTSGATLCDGSHDLIVYKCEDISKIKTCSYLDLPYYIADIQKEVPSLFNKSIKEMFTMKTILCSTKFTQNVNILSLLKWRTNNKEEIQESLKGVLTLDNEELVKFLQDVLDSLFAIFSNEEGNSTEYSGLVFHVLVSIFNLLQSKKFQFFKPVIDAYIENHFAAPLVYKGLIISVKHLAMEVKSDENIEPFEKCFKSLEYIFKLIIQSRKLFSQAMGGQYEDSFRNELFSLFSSFNKMLSIPSSNFILPIQEALLKSIGVALEQLRYSLSAPELGIMLRNLFDAIPREADIKLVQTKLHSIKDIVSGKLFNDDEFRSVILQIACKHLKLHFLRKEEINICSAVAAVMLSKIYEQKLVAQSISQDSSILNEDINSMCKSLLTVLMQTIIALIDGSSIMLSKLISITLGLIQVMDETNYKFFWDELSGGTDDYTNIKDFLITSFFVFKELLSQNWNVYNDDWFVLKMASNNVIRKSLEEFSNPLVYKFLQHDRFDMELWCEYFKVVVCFVTQSTLQIEKYPELKKRQVLQNYGDMRVTMGFQVLSMWSQLGDKKCNFIPFMIGPILEITLVPETSLRKSTIEVFYDMIQCEQEFHGSFQLIESELINKIDFLINEDRGDDEYSKLFKSVLTQKIGEKQPIWKEDGINFINSVSLLLERLLDYRNVMQGDENRDKRMTCTVNLLNFYKDEINRTEIYLRYIYKLHDLHLQSENYTEAGFTLKLYADKLSWVSEKCIDNKDETKEELYYKIISYFDKGKNWEEGIPLCKELAELYEHCTFDYNKLSAVLKMQADFFQNILVQIRPEPEYFRVGFYGKSFPSFVQNKEFVYRGVAYERIGSFTQRLQLEFPNSQILTKSGEPDDTLKSSCGQFLQINNVKPCRKSIHNVFDGNTSIPDRIVRYYDVNDVDEFIYDRPIYKGPVDKDNEFKSLWVERTKIKVSSSFPGILRCFEIISKNTEELTPIEFACETMLNVQKELVDLIKQYSKDRNKNINPFSMRLQGIIDANVMGGISKYQEAFFCEEYSESNDEYKQENVQKLLKLIIDQLHILEKALKLHGEIAPETVQPLHLRLNDRFLQLKKNLTLFMKTKKYFAESIINTPLPPLPNKIPIDEIIRDKKSSNDRPKSLGYIHFNPSPDVPPKTSSSKLRVMSSPNAPPLPPRGITPDKRNSNPYFYVDLNINNENPRAKSTLLVSSSLEETIKYEERTEWFSQIETQSNDYIYSEPPPIPPKKDQ